MIQFSFTGCLTFITILISLFFISKRLLPTCFVIMSCLSFLTWFTYEFFILFFFLPKHIYNGLYEFLNVTLWLLFIVIFFVGSRGEYRDKDHFDIETEVDSTPENTYANVMQRLSWDFEDEYLEYMDWSDYKDEYFKFRSTKKESKDSF